MLNLVLYLTLLALCLAAVALNVISLPGNWVMLLMAAGWWWFQAWGWMRWYPLLAMLVVLLIGEALEFFGGVVARKMGGSRMASFFALIRAPVGGLLGFYIPVPVVGNIIGAIAGAFVAAWSVEMLKDKPLKAATRAATGAALGRGAGILAKLACGMAVWFGIAVFGWPWI